MDIGQKIKFLRRKAGLTQEQLGERLNLSAQSVSKWETGAAMPDITLLPLISKEFGVSIDEIFDLTQEDRLQRIEKRMELEEELPADIFREYEDELKRLLREGDDRYRATSMLAYLYHHRMRSDARRVSHYAREAIMLSPEKKDCQWLLERAEGETAWDWNISNHAGLIDFYKQVIAADHITPRTPMPYYYLIDYLIADRRTQEAAQYVDQVEKLPACSPVLPWAYRAHIALIEKGQQAGDAIIEEALQMQPQSSGMMFEAAQYYARTCQYDKAIALYERCYKAEEEEKPRFSDPLQGMAIIHEIRGDYASAIRARERELENLKTEWGYTDEAPVQETLREIQRLSKKAAK